MLTHNAVIGLGANLDDPVQKIIDARNRLLKDTAIIALECSSLYLSSPVGDNSQEDFLNCVCFIETHLTAFQLLDLLQSIENEMGRTRNPENQNAPRIIDLDLILFADQQIETQRLTVPHPRLHERRFVLEPLFELMPDRMINQTKNVSQVLTDGRQEGCFVGQALYRIG